MNPSYAVHEAINSTDKESRNESTILSNKGGKSSKQADPDTLSCVPCRDISLEGPDDRKDVASDILDTSKSNPCHTAQVAINRLQSGNPSKSTTSPNEGGKSPRQAYPEHLGCVPCRDISAKGPEDGEAVVVRGILTVSEKVVVVDYYNRLLKLFDDCGTILTSTALNDYTWGITRVSDARFATCGLSNEVRIWNIYRETVTYSDVTYHISYNAHGIHYNGTYYCVLHRENNVITILDGQGGHIRHIKDVFDREIKFGWGIFMEEHSHDIYVPCRGYNDGVVCMSVEGNALWFSQRSATLKGITEICGVLCIADYSNGLYLLSKAGKYERKLLLKNDMNGKPDYIYFDDKTQKLYVSYRDPKDRRHVISVYSVTC